MWHIVEFKKIIFQNRNKKYTKLFEKNKIDYHLTLIDFVKKSIPGDSDWYSRPYIFFILRKKYSKPYIFVNRL
jgi:hypothetical protein